MAEDRATPETEKGVITGRHVLIGVIAAFTVILSVNMVMVVAATGSFPGLVVKNSYIASQEFNARSAALADLGWRATIGHADGALTAAIATRGGSPAAAQNVVAVVGRPSDAKSDRTIQLERDPTTGAFTSALELPPGLWRVSLTAEAMDGAAFTAETRIVTK